MAQAIPSFGIAARHCLYKIDQLEYIVLPEKRKPGRLVAEIAADLENQNQE